MSFSAGTLYPIRNQNPSNGEMNLSERNKDNICSIHPQAPGIGLVTVFLPMNASDFDLSGSSSPLASSHRPRAHQHWAAGESVFHTGPDVPNDSNGIDAKYDTAMLLWSCWILLQLWRLACGEVALFSG